MVKIVQVIATKFAELFSFPKVTKYATAKTLHPNVKISQAKPPLTRVFSHNFRQKRSKQVGRNKAQLAHEFISLLL